MPAPFKISAVKEENAYTKTFTLEGRLTGTPGQFVMIWLPEEEDRPYSLVSCDPIRLTIAAVGPFSRKLCQLDVGDFIWLRGPLGRGYQLPDRASGISTLLLVGESYLISSLLFLGRQAAAEGFNVTLLLGAPNVDDFTGVDAVRAAGLPHRLITHDGSRGQQGTAVSLLRSAVREAPPEKTAVYASGLDATLQEIAQFCKEANIPFQLAFKTPMKCGIGLCGTCEIENGWLACVDGPVLSHDPFLST